MKSQLIPDLTANFEARLQAEIGNRIDWTVDNKGLEAMLNALIPGINVCVRDFAIN